MRGIQRSPVNSPHKVLWRGTLMFSLIRAWTNGWANKRDTGDLRRHRTHYDVTLMWIIVSHGHLVRLTLRNLFKCLIVRFAIFIEIVLVHICNDPYTFKRESVWFSIHMLESVSNAFGPRNTAIGILKFIIKFYLLGHNALVLQYICNRYWLKFIVTACLKPVRNIDKILILQFGNIQHA